MDNSLDSDKYGYSTSRVCSICKKNEYTDAELIDNCTWICSGCAEKLGNIIGVRTATKSDNCNSHNDKFTSIINDLKNGAQPIVCKSMEGLKLK